MTKLRAMPNAQLQRWRHTYNMQRPHEALGMCCSGEVYVPSTRRLPRRIPAAQYGGQFQVVKANSAGYIRLDDFKTYLSETMAGCPIELRPSEDGEVIIACYRNFKIAEFSARNGERLNRKISRL